MARRRLNKKVLFMGMLVVLIAAAVSIVLILRYGRDPGKYISDGDAAFAEKQYDVADRNYRKAYSYAKNDELKIDILYKLVELHRNTDRWRDILGFWTEIIRLDPRDVKARFGKLRYFYIMADSGGRFAWKDVKSQVDEFLEKSDEQILSQNIVDLDYFNSVDELKGQKLGPYLYMVRGRAILENATYGAETDPQAALIQAKSDVEKVIELEPDNVEAFWYLSLIVKENGRIAASKGNVEERDKALKQAQEILEKAVKVAGDNPNAHINLLTMKLSNLLEEQAGQDKIKALESEYLAVTKKFNSNAKAFNSLCSYYLALGPKEMDNAIAAAEKSCELDSKNVSYGINAAILRYRNYTIYKDLSSLNKATEIINTSLDLPDAQDKPGPKSWRGKMNRISLYSFLGQCYLEKILEPSFRAVKTDSTEEIKKMGDIVHNIEQLYGSGEEPQVRKWQGILEYISGNKTEAIKKLYATYEQLSAAGGGDWLLSYILGKYFNVSSDLGSARIFFSNAINAGAVSYKPEVLLDYAEILIKFRIYEDALNIFLKTFDERFGTTQRSRYLKINAYIGSRQFDEAEKEISGIDKKDPNSLKFGISLITGKRIQLEQAIARKQIREGEVSFAEQPSSEPESTRNYDLMREELKGYKNSLADKVKNLLSIDPNMVSAESILMVCQDYISQRQSDKAKEVITTVLKRYPANVTFLYYDELLKEPNVTNITPQRYGEIELKVLETVDEPINRALGIGTYYQRQNEPNKAIVEYKKALKAKDLEEGVIEVPPFEKDDKLRKLQILATSNLFDMAVGIKNLKLAEQISEVAKRENIDECEGQFIQARLALAKKDMKNAVALADRCLSQRPIFSYAYALRSTARASLGDLVLAVEDARKAGEYNPLDSFIAKTLALVIYQRNEKIGSNVTSAQRMELRDALIRAMSINPGELELQSFYAEYISKENPDEALAIRQRLQKISPSLDNTLLLGRMAVRVAVNERDKNKKELYFSLAAKSFDQALAIDPKNREVLSSYAEYYRLTGQGEQAEKMLGQSQSDDVLFAYYIRASQYEMAKKIAENLYKKNPKDPNSIKRLLAVADTTYDRDAVKKLSDEILSVEDTKENQLSQIQSFLKVGLLKEAEGKLESFNEKYPKDSSSLLLSAWLSMRKGQIEKAFEQVNQSLQINSENAAGWRLRGEINRLSAKYSDAINDLKKSKSLSDSGDTRISLARTYLSARLYEDAITELKDTIVMQGAPVQARDILEWTYIQTDRKKELNDFYKETLQSFPDSIDWHNRAAIFAMREKDYATGEKLFYKSWQKSQELGKPSMASLDGYLYALIMQGRYDKVLEESRKYTEGELAPVAFFRMGEAKKKLGDEETAKQYCKKAVEMADTNESVLTNILEEMLSLFGSQEVEKYCSDRLNASPNSIAANFSMAKIMRIKGEYNKSIDYIDKCINIVGADNLKSLGYVVEKATVLQLAYDKTSDNVYLQRSIEVYQSLLEKMPTNADVMNNLAYMLAENNQMLEKAMEYAAAAYDTASDNPGFMDTYAYVLYKNNKFEQAEQLVQSALQQYEKSKASAPWEVYEHLGLIKEALKKNSEALTAYKKALEVATDGLADKVKKRIEAAVERVSK